MRAVVITKHGGPGVLEVQERPDPELGPGEVRIDVAAAGINFADVMARMGLYPDAPKPPCVVGYEVAGTILELGEGVTGLNHGQRVLAGTQFGGYASQVSVPANDVVALPDRLSFEQGAAIPVNYATAWAGLIGYGNLQPGERVLIHSAGGGVGIAATQIAKHSGAEVYGTASPGKHVRIKEARRRPRARLHSERMGAWASEVRCDPRCRRRQELSHELLAAELRRAPRGFRRFRARVRSAAQPAHGAPHGHAHAALQHDQTDVRIEGRDRAEHAHAVEGQRHARAVDRAPQ